MGTTEQIIDFSKLKANCSKCNLHELCLPRGLSTEDIERLDHVIKGSSPIQKGESIFRIGDTFNAFFAVRSGCIKTYILNEAGEEQITGFYFPGEVFGFDAIDKGHHCCESIALETSTVCSIPYEKIKDICSEVPELQSQIFCLMSRELSDEHKLLLTINKRTAEERIATFLVNLSNRFQALGYSSKEFNLPMSRQEIGNYLGLTIETVSRLFTKFQRNKLVKINRKMVSLEDLPALHAMCSGAHGSSQSDAPDTVKNTVA